MFGKDKARAGSRWKESHGSKLAAALGAMAFSVEPGSLQSEEVGQLSPQNSQTPQSTHTQMHLRDLQVNRESNSTIPLDRAGNGCLPASPHPADVRNNA